MVYPMGNLTSNESSLWGSNSHGISCSVDPKELCFTQEDINGSFSKRHRSVRVSDVVADIKAGKLYPSRLGPLDMHRGSSGEIWCENNQSLWAFWHADVPPVDMKYKNNDYKSRLLDDKTKNMLEDPNYLPKIRSFGV